MSKADGYVLPKPGIPKTLGILSTIFAVLMVLYGLCMTGYMAALPAIMQASTQVLKKAQEQTENIQKAEVKAIDDQEAAATTDEQKAALKQQRDAIDARPKVTAPDFKAVTDMVSNPTILTNTYITLGTGLILSIVLLVTGIGLIRLTPWGRTLGMWWAGFQIVQILILLVINLIFVLPVSQAAQKKMMDQMMVNANAQGGANNAAQPGMQMAQAMSGVAGAMVVVYAIIGCVYPIIVLVLLNTAGAKAACLPKQDPELAGF